MYVTTYFNYFTVFLKALFLVLFSSLFTLLLSALLYLILPLIIIYMQTILSYISHSPHSTSPLIFLNFRILSLRSLPGCLLICSLSINLRLNFFLLVFLNNFLKYLTLSFKCLLVYLSRLYHLLVILVLYLTLHYPCLISAISKSCLSHIRDLRRIRNTLDLTTAKTIATSLVHSRLDYCNSIFLYLPSSELNRLQLVLHANARAITKTSKFLHITPILKSLCGAWWPSCQHTLLATYT